VHSCLPLPWLPVRMSPASPAVPAEFVTLFFSWNFSDLAIIDRNLTDSGEVLTNSGRYRRGRSWEGPDKKDRGGDRPRTCHSLRGSRYQTTSMQRAGSNCGSSPRGRLRGSTTRSPPFRLATSRHEGATGRPRQEHTVESRHLAQGVAGNALRGTTSTQRTAITPSIFTKSRLDGLYTNAQTLQNTDAKAISSSLATSQMSARPRLLRTQGTDRTGLHAKD
jgi:hypothetical protein